MRIGIDAHILGKQKGAVEHTVEVLIRGLAEFDFANTYFVYTTGLHPFRRGELPPNFVVKLVPGSPWLGRLILLPYYYHRDRLDVLYVQRAIPFFGCARTVLHIHDAMYATHPHLFPMWKRTIFNSIFRWSGSHATAVVTPTESSRAEVAKAYGVNPSNTHVLPDTADLRELFPEEPGVFARPLADKFGVKQPYVIYVGAIERNKNVHGLLDAFRIFRQEHPAFQLVLVGKKRSETRGGYAEEIRQKMDAPGLAGSVISTGWVSKQERRWLLCGASMLVFPSEAEGLGLPPLEAMACGTPAIASDLPSIREAYGDSLLRSKVADTADLAELMARVADDSALAKALIQRGLVRAARDPWNYKAEKMLAIFRRAAGCLKDS